MCGNKLKKLFFCVFFMIRVIELIIYVLWLFMCFVTFKYRDNYNGLKIFLDVWGGILEGGVLG